MIPEVSIIIVNFGNIDFVQNCLDSLITNTKKVSYEIICVNNLVKESDTNILREEYNAKCNIQFINNETNLGFAAANNQALKIANGKYLLLLNNDTIFIENSIKKIFDYVETQNQKLIVGCKLLNEDKSHQISIGKFDSLTYLFSTNFFLYKLFPHSKRLNKYYLNYLKFSEPTIVDFVKGAFLFISKDNMEKLKGFDESFYFYGEETDLCFRFAKIGGEVVYFPNTSIIHLGGATTDKMPWFKFRNQTISKLKTYKRQFNGLSYFVALLLHYCGLLIRVPIYFIGGVFTLNKYLILKSYYYSKQLFVLSLHNNR
ncbi:MAG: glycosyltransferase family 2 protein [Arcobacter sp.]|nr:glycosyltransferase family 2 protein [Arcobacter sp.]